MVCDLLKLGSEEFDRFKRKLCVRTKDVMHLPQVWFVEKNRHPAIRNQTSDLAMCWSDEIEMGSRVVAK